MESSVSLCYTFGGLYFDPLKITVTLLSDSVTTSFKYYINRESILIMVTGLSVVPFGYRDDREAGV